MSEPPQKLVRRRGACGRCKTKKTRCDGLRPSCSTCVKAGNATCSYDSDANAAARLNFGGSQNGQSRGAGTEVESSSPASRHSMSADIAALPPGLLSTVPLAPADQNTREYQSPYPPSSSATIIPNEIDTPIDIFGVDGTLIEFPIDIDSNTLSDTRFCEPWVFDTSLPDLNGSLGDYTLNNHLKDPSSKTRNLSERLFPSHGQTDGLEDNGDTLSESEKARANYLMDSAILSISHEWFTSLSTESPVKDPCVGNILKRLIYKLRNRPIRNTIREKPNFSEEVFLNGAPVQTLHSYIQAFFEHPFSCFFTPEDAHEWLSIYLNTSSSGRSSVEPLLNAIFAIGYRTANAKEGLFDRGPDNYFALALAARGRLLEGEPSILKIQSLITMALYLYGSPEEELTWSIISNAVQLVFALRLNKSKGIEKSARTSQEASMLRRMFWIIYAIEKPLVMHLNRCSLIEDASIDYTPELQPRGFSNQGFEKIQFLIHLVQYAKICSMITKSLYSFSHAQRRHTLTPVIRRVQALLQEWKECLPDNLQVLPHGFRPPHGTSSQQLRNMVDFTLKYHEAVIVIYQRGETCLQSGRAILSLTQYFECDQSNPHWAYLYLPIVSYIMLVLNLVEASTPQKTKENMPYLVIANGWAGKLALCFSWDFGFSEMMELSQVAQGIWSSAQKP